MKLHLFTITKDDHNRRIDRIIRHFLPDMPLSGIYKLLRKGLIRIDGKKVSPNYHVVQGSEIGISSELLDSVRVSANSVSPGFIPVILMETADLLIINKPEGISVHGEGGLDGLIPQTNDSSQSLSFRTGPLHRLDRDTTGILAFSRSLEGAQWFSSCVQSHIFEKYYLGIIEGHLESECKWNDTDIDGKEMITFAVPLAFSKKGSIPMTLTRFQIITGRKHQIRIQSSRHGYPLFGDERYGGSRIFKTFSLHAWHLVFPEMRLKDIPENLTAPIPKKFKERIKENFGMDVLAYIEQGELYWKQYDEH